jgi:hypothetical protein
MNKDGDLQNGIRV